jgi:peroxiredoxin
MMMKRFTRSFFSDRRRPVAVFIGGALLALWPNAGVAQETVPEFRLPTIEGAAFDMKDVVGKKTIVINFWATWCVPCRREMLHLQKLYDQYRDAGLQVIAISIDDASKQSQVKPFVKSYKYTYPVLLDTDSIVFKKFQTQPEIPLTLVIDKRGRIVRRFQGYKPGDEATLKAEITKLLDQQ